MKADLTASKVHFTELDSIVDATMEQVEAFMASHKDCEEEWKFRLTQSQDVTKWIENPEVVDPTIRKNLDDLKGVVQELEAPVSVLDVGCHGGYVFDFLKSLPITYTGMDIRPELIKEAARLHSAYKNAVFKKGSVFGLKRSTKASEFDLVVCSRVLIHLPRFGDAVRNLLHATKKTLVIISKVEAKANCKLIKKHDETRGESMTYFYRVISFDDVAQIAKDFGVGYRVLGADRPYQSIILRKRA